MTPASRVLSSVPEAVVVYGDGKILPFRVRAEAKFVSDSELAFVSTTNDSPLMVVDQTDWFVVSVDMVTLPLLVSTSVGTVD